MTIKIITDSTADLPPELAEQLGITVVPAYLKFGKEVYRDRISFSVDEFYKKMVEETVFPVTEPATPEDFAEVYREAAKDAEGILSIHISSKISATCAAAAQGQLLAEVECPVEVIDSESVSMGLGLVTIAAAELVQSGMTFPRAIDEIKRILPEVRLLGFFDTVRYLARGGRINRASAFFGSMLNVKPMLTMQHGEVEPAGQLYRRAVGIRKLFQFAKNTPNIQSASVVHSTTEEEARDLAERITALVPSGRTYLTRMGPVLGTHGGPGALLVALRVQSK
jgi:DegV family protein with EDD domain